MKLFVYGSLMRGFWNNRLLDGARLVGEAVTPGSMISLGAFPGVKTHSTWKDNPVVYGELYKIDDAILARCDRLEGYRGPDDPHNFYVRKIVPVATLSDKEPLNIEAFIYEWNGDNTKYYYETIKSGNWREHVASHQNK